MTRRQNRWIKERRERLVREYGGKCEVCKGTSKLEFAHKEPTELSGWGRGRKERVHDVIRNPTKYRLLCKDCHEMYDKGILEECAQ